jgi:hypothetical protein
MFIMHKFAARAGLQPVPCSTCNITDFYYCFVWAQIANLRQRGETSSHSRESICHSEETSSHSRESFSHSEETPSHSRESFCHSEETSSHSRESFCHSKETFSHSRESFCHSKETSSHSRESFSHSEETPSQSKMYYFFEVINSPIKLHKQFVFFLYACT